MRLANILQLILTVAEAAAWCTKPGQRCWKRAAETMETRQPVPVPPVNQGSWSQVQGSQHQRRWNTWPRQSRFSSEELADVSEVSTSPDEVHEPLTNWNRRSNQCEKCSWIKSRSFPSDSLDESDEKQHFKHLKPQLAADAVTRAAIDTRNIQTLGIHDMPYREASDVGRRDPTPAPANCLLKDANWCGVSYRSRSVLRQPDCDIPPPQTRIKSYVTDMPFATPAAVEGQGDRKVKTRHIKRHVTDMPVARPTAAERRGDLKIRTRW